MAKPLKSFVVLAAATMLVGCSFNSGTQAPVGTTQALRSPDRTLGLRVATTPMLSYALAVDGRPLLVPSALGLQFAENNLTLGPDAQIVSAKVTSHDSTWSTHLYKREQVRDRYNELLLTLRQRSAPETTFQIVFRLYNDGLAFRYILPAPSAAGTKHAPATAPAPQSLTLEKELTAFTFPADARCFAGSQAGGYAGAQEWEFLPTHLAALPGSRPTGLPLLVHAPAPQQNADAWVAITESDLVDFPGLWLSPSVDAPRPADAKGGGAVMKVSMPPEEPLTGKPVALHAHPAPRLDGKGLARLSLPHTTPWRVVMVARDPGKLIESDLVQNLATPSKIGDDAWVKPGITAWDHWWTGGTQMNTATLKQYIQLAADMGWPYQLVDWYWYGKPNNPAADITKVDANVDMPELLRFAKERNVRLLLWLHSGDVARNDAYRKAFPLYEQWGIAGVKIDFMDRDDQEMVNWYEAVTKEAAEHHLMVNFHGAYKPTGMGRTYPNQITREGVLGNEYNRWSERVTPEHKLTLPFTRFLAGPGDFTPGGFLNRQPSQFKVDNKATEVQGTRAAELALFVLYDSPLTCACDHPDHYRDQPGADFLKIVPTTWKNTKVLQASVAEYLVEARQAHDDDYFLAAMTNSKGRTLEVPLDFLPPGRNYKLTMWEDAPDSATDATHLDVSIRTVTSKDKLTLTLAPAGGAVAHFHRE